MPRFFRRHEMKFVNPTDELLRVALTSGDVVCAEPGEVIEVPARLEKDLLGAGFKAHKAVKGAKEPETASGNAE